MEDMRVAAVQFEHASGDKQANLDKVTSFVERAAGHGVELIVFPECCVTGYWFLRNLSREELEGLAEPVPDGPSARLLLRLAERHGVGVGAGLVEIGEDGNLYNTYVVAMPDGGIRRHRKIHCFINRHMSCGSEYTLFDIAGGCRAAILTCYDNNIIENTRMVALGGAELLLAPHQTGGCQTPSPHCMGLIDVGLWERREEDAGAIEAELRGRKGRQWLMTWLPARAHDNGLFLVFSNGVGIDDDQVRTGNAMILDPYGRVLAETWKAGDDMVVADLDAKLRDNCTGARWMRTRRPELYGPLTVRTGQEEDLRRSRFGKDA